ncbi:MAG: cell division protein FtsZ [Bacteroidales bacterium]|jgi:cell division protein FtsZ|nr:cell division protein FtsZ [Bacteroidales bacterium]MCI2122228.1 cell division protein FtsZ [Bacteroidales bacterium]MCI2145564.1 cell division protein FtsZ [Bacteroidales bacterium]
MDKNEPIIKDLNDYDDMEDIKIIPNDWKKTESIITVIGVGGGGNNAVTHMYHAGIKEVNFMICNTDKQVLEDSDVPNKLQLGEVLTKGLGAGCDPETGRKAALESLKKIKDFLEGSTEMVFITCGMGGGTGTGAAPVIAEAAKEKGLLVIGVITLPFRDEGPAARNRAIAGLAEMKKHVDSLLVVDNNKLYEIYGKDKFFEAFPKADEVLCTAVKGIADIIHSHGHINVDFADVKMVMKNSGIALIGIGEGEGEGRALKAVTQAFTSPLLNELDLSTARSALVNITTGDGDDSMKMEEFSQIMDYINDYTGNADNFKRGVVKDHNAGSKIMVTVIATGFEMTSLPQFVQIDSKDKIYLKPEEAEGMYQTGAPIQKTLHNENTTPNVHFKPNEKPALIVGEDDSIDNLEIEPAFKRRDRMIQYK